MKLKEWHRTVILVALIAFALAYIYWLRTGYDANLLDILG